MKVLVTGGAGFIGSNYVRHVLGGTFSGFKPERLVVLDKFTYAGNRANLADVADNPRLDIVEGDICDPEVVRQAMAGADLVVHFAAESHVDRSIAGSAEFVMTNVVGTHTLLRSACDLSVDKFVHISTDEVYGSIESGSWPEDHVLAPNSPYSSSKAGSDLLARSFYVTHGLDVSITRCSNNYGPYQYPEKIIPLFATNLLDGLDVPLYGDGLNVREWLHVDDHCRGVQLVAEHGRPGEIYNVGGGAELTNKELVERLLAELDASSERVVAVADRKGHDRRYSVDITKITTELGYQPSVNFDDGLAETVAWYRRNRDWWEPLKKKGTIVAGV